MCEIYDTSGVLLVAFGDDPSTTTFHIKGHLFEFKLNKIGARVQTALVTSNRVPALRAALEEGRQSFAAAKARLERLQQKPTMDKKRLRDAEANVHDLARVKVTIVESHQISTSLLEVLDP